MVPCSFDIITEDIFKEWDVADKANIVTLNKITTQIPVQPETHRTRCGKNWTQCF